MTKLIGNHPRGLTFVLSAPAGTGKTTLVRMLSDEFSCVHESVSCTTRPLRAGEKEGVDYYFLSVEAFAKKRAQGDFLESAEVFGHHYGTSRQKVEEQLARGQLVFLVIDTQGAMQLQEKNYHACYIFISPPSFETLRDRLVNRQTDSAEVIEKRLSWAQEEIARKERYDYHIINEELPCAYAVLRSIVIAEDHRNDNKRTHGIQ
jgi:guanylate kinase